MTRLKNFYHKVEVHPITLIYLVFAILGGYLKWYLSTLVIVCMHELCHLLMAYYFHFDIQKIEILPFGAYLSLNDFYFHPIIQEICVVLAGPCSHLFIWLIIQLFQNGVYYDYLIEMNAWVFFFNLVPIYPMDGSRLVGLALQAIMDLKKALYMNLKISVFVFSLLSVFYLQNQTFVIISYLLIQQFYYKKFISDYLRKYYSQIPGLYKMNKIKVHDCLIYRRGYHNYYRVQGQTKDEKEMIFLFLEDVKK